LGGPATLGGLQHVTNGLNNTVQNNSIEIPRLVGGINFIGVELGGCRVQTPWGIKAFLSAIAKFLVSYDTHFCLSFAVDGRQDFVILPRAQVT